MIVYFVVLTLKLSKLPTAIPCSENIAKNNVKIKPTVHLKRLEMNENINFEIKKILLVREVYPELNNNTKYVKFEKHLVRMNKILSKLQAKYNKALDAYLSRKKVFPSELICVICNFYSYNYFNLK